jgi:hypothetical protein
MRKADEMVMTTLDYGIVDQLIGGVAPPVYLTVSIFEVRHETMTVAEFKTRFSEALDASSGEDCGEGLCFAALTTRSCRNSLLSE